MDREGRAMVQKKKGTPFLSHTSEAKKGGKLRDRVIGAKKKLVY